jgi:hypothetical protein
MIDLSTIPDDVLIARGMYSTVRTEHEDAKQRLAIKCGSLSSLASQILKRMQENDVAIPNELLWNADITLHDIQRLADEIVSLAIQRQELKPKAWPK